jgi:chromatin segregation and condensation protein Rec8/ScpA/Scc1 (kleisin family)
MVFKILANIGGKILTPGASEKQEVAERALTVNGLTEYKETESLIANLKNEMKDAATKFQKRQMEDQIHRYGDRQDALRSAAVILAGQIGKKDHSEIFRQYDITDQDIARVSSGVINPRISPPHEVARFLIEEAESDFISGRA